MKHCRHTRTLASGQMSRCQREPHPDEPYQHRFDFNPSGKVADQVLIFSLQQVRQEVRRTDNAVDPSARSMSDQELRDFANLHLTGGWRKTRKDVAESLATTP